jgi:SprT protein
VTELQEKAIKRIHQVYEKAQTIYGIPLQLPTISFKLKGRRAGYVVPAYQKLTLNNTLLHTYGDDFINDTPGHEAAHLIAYQVYGYMIEPHGKQWKKVMVDVCGQNPNRCHSFEVKTNHIYSCKCNPSIYLSTTKHNRIQSNKQNYYCLDCNTIIKWNKLHEKTTNFSGAIQVAPQISATIYR